MKSIRQTNWDERVTINKARKNTHKTEKNILSVLNINFTNKKYYLIRKIKKIVNDDSNFQ
jgi:hypothetical protein